MSGEWEESMRGRHPLLALLGVRQLHSRRDFSGDGYGWTACAECRQCWPCATELAIRNAEAIPAAAGVVPAPTPEKT